MSSVIRHVINTTGDGNANIAISSTGKEYQLVSFYITLTQAINANVNADIFKWTGAGKIYNICGLVIRNAAGLLYKAGDGVAGLTITTDKGDNTIINLAVGNDGVAIAAGSKISLLLVIGNY
jgi:hypothetical protein